MNKFDYVKKQRQDVAEIPEKWVKQVRFFLKVYTKVNVWVFKKSKGRLMKNFPGGYPICIVGMIGKQTGKRREIPLIHLPRDDKKYLVASQGGMNTHPVWYFNIKSNPDIDILYGGVTHSFRARQLSIAEKIEVWPYLLTLYPDFDEYQARTDRDIPIFICEPAANKC